MSYSVHVASIVIAIIMFLCGACSCLLSLIPVVRVECYFANCYVVCVSLLSFVLFIAEAYYVSNFKASKPELYGGYATFFAFTIIAIILMFCCSMYQFVVALLKRRWNWTNLKVGATF